MTLSAGTRLGPYEVISPLGAGGMGEVYRARDTRLAREVAIKVLPAALAADPERLKRFEREARSASALNHPNIVTIYDIGSSNAISYIAMELVEGESLRGALTEGALPVKSLLQIATQVADGLAKAHASGIVHRDLKPENVMVTEDSLVKILDFGLAKLTQPEGSGSGATQAPTVSGATEPGIVMGTVGYMSPEQALGKSVDFRSDQFSFGSILYEMATGRRAFQRGSAPQTLTAIIQDEPEPIAELNPKIPVPVRWMVERCLAKEARNRYASTEDLARDLATVRDRLSEATSAVGAVPVSAEPVRRRRHARQVLAALAALAVLSLSVLAGLRLGRAEAPSYQQLTFRRGTIFSARFAPNGSVVYGAAWNGKPFRLFVSTLTGPDSRELDLADADLLSISSSGEMAISLGRHFHRTFNTKGTLAQVSLSGGAPRLLLEDVEWADWMPDGKTLAIVREVGGKDRLECPVGRVLYETPGWISDIRASRDGERIAFLDHPDPVAPRGSVVVVDRRGRKQLLSREAGRGAHGLAWSPRGDEVWFTAGRGLSLVAGSIQAVSLSGSIQAVSLSGKERLVARVPGGLTLHDTSPDGRVLIGRETGRIGMIGLMPGEAAEKDISWFDSSTIRGISPDGRTILFFEGGDGGGKNYSIYVGKTDGSTPVRVGEGVACGLSPEGTRVLAVEQESSPAHVIVYPVGPGESQTLPGGSIEYSWANWFPDGKRILSTGSEPNHGRRLYVQDLAGGPARAISGEGVSFSWDALSPDARWAAAGGPGGTISLYPVEGGPPRPIPGLTAADEPIGWSEDARSLFVYRRGELPARVERVDVGTGRRALWKQLMPPDPVGVTGIIRIRTTPDGRYYAYSFRRLVSELYVADGLK
ncbi:MAG: protein kinase domain-containing protein [Thermoanaerobaculia bacterium]